MIRYRLLKIDGLVDWINLIWSSSLVRSQIERMAKTSAGIWKVSQADLARVIFPLPPEKERLEVVARIDDAFLSLGAVQEDVSSRIVASESLRQSILGAAFAGKLVPQDPADEPAARLLERIAAERAAVARSPGSGRRGRRPRPGEGRSRVIMAK